MRFTRSPGVRPGHSNNTAQDTQFQTKFYANSSATLGLEPDEGPAFVRLEPIAIEAKFQAGANADDS